MGYQNAPLVMEAHVGTRRTLAIMGAATAALALGAASAPSAHAVEENRVSEEYMIHQSGRVSWSVTIDDYQQALTQEQCEELGTSAQTVFSTNEEASISFTRSSGSRAKNRCEASLRVELTKTPLMQAAGTTTTLTLKTAIPDSVMTAVGMTARKVRATVFDAGIVESSDGAEIDHDSRGNGWETAEWKNVSGDLSITYDSALGNRNGRAGASPTPGSRSTPSPRSTPNQGSTPGASPSPSNQAVGQNPPGSSDDNTVLIVVAVVVGVIVIAAVAGAVVIVMRSRRAHTGPGGYAGIPYPDGQGPGGLPGQGHGRTPGYGQAQGYGQSSGSAVPAGQSFPFGDAAVPQSPPGASAGAQTGPSAGGSASSALGLPPVPAPPKQRSPFAPDEDS